jgi:hypothetical protein
LDTIAGGPTGRQRPLFHTFETLKEKISDAPQDFWDAVVDLHSLILGWYENRSLFHKIGFLVAENVVSFRGLIQHSVNRAKSDFESELDSLIRDSLKLTQAELRGLSYQNSKTERALLLMNVEAIRQRQHSAERYSFKEHAVGQWSIEHIHAQNAEQLNRADQWAEWLRLHRRAFAAVDVGDSGAKDALLGRIDAVLAKPPIKEAEFRPLEQVLSAELSENGNPSDSDVDSIANLALLDGRDNSALSNSVFAVKRAAVLARDRRGSYIPVCTRNVFLKYYSPADDQQMHFWSATDRTHYLEAMIETLHGFLLSDQVPA